MQTIVHHHRTARQAARAILVAVLGILSFQAGPASGSELESHGAARVEVAPRVDGDLFDSAWRGARAGPLLQASPHGGDPASEPTEFRVVYTSSTLFIAIWCFESDPDEIVASEMARDGDLWSDDHVSITLDTFRDGRNGYVLRVNPNGARADFLVADNAEGNRSWDGIWRARATRDDRGWYVEVAIPFTTIGFDETRSVWGLNVERRIARRNEIDRWSGAKPHVYAWHVDQAGELTGLVGIEQGLGIQVTPYVLGKYRDERSDDDVDRLFDAGLDARYSITPNLIASVSFNTDFAETEVDARQINLTRFPLFFPEKREFFLQDAGIFRFGNLDQNLVPFFSRRVGLGKDGEVVPILGAAKLTGRLGDYNIGVLDAVLDEHDDVGTRNAFVGRLSRNILESSSIGAIVTHGDPNSDLDNTLAGTDFNFRAKDFLGDWIAHGSAFALGTYTEESDGASNSQNLAFGSKVEAEEDYLIASLSFYQIGEDFNPALGFVPRKDVRAYDQIVTYRPRLESIDAVRQIWISYWANHTTNLDDEIELITHSLTWLYVQFESTDEIFFNSRLLFESLDEDFPIAPDVTIPRGEYWYPQYRLGFISASKRPITASAFMTWGDFYDGHNRIYRAELAWKPCKHFRLEATYELNEVRLPQGDFDTRLAFVRAQVGFTPDLSWSNLVQYDNLSDRIGVQSRIAWEFRPGADAYIVMNQNVARNDGRARVEETEVAVKVGVALRF